MNMRVRSTRSVPYEWSLGADLSHNTRCRRDDRNAKNHHRYCTTAAARLGGFGRVGHPSPAQAVGRAPAALANVLRNSVTAKTHTRPALAEIEADARCDSYRTSEAKAHLVSVPLSERIDIHAKLTEKWSSSVGNSRSVSSTPEIMIQLASVSRTSEGMGT